MELLSAILMGMPGGGLILIPLISLLFAVVALIDILKHDFKGNEKIIWVVVIILLPVFGAILYFSIGYSQKIDKPNLD